MNSNWWSLGFVIVALFVFIVSLLVISNGTARLRSSVNELFYRAVESPASALGIGWLAASVFLNGSVVAASALALFDAGIVSITNAFMLVGGSRLGASFIVLLFGVLEYIGGATERMSDSLTVGILSFFVTFTIYVPAIGLGALLLTGGYGRYLYFQLPAAVHGSLIGWLEPIAKWVVSQTGAGWGIVIGFVLLLGSFKVFDRALKAIDQGIVSPVFLQFAEKPWLSFLVGASLTVVTASIAFSIGTLVPLYAANFLSRRSIIPYVLGANVTTLMDTLFAGLVLNNPGAVSLVLLLMLVAVVVSVPYLIVYPIYLDSLRWLMNQLAVSNRRLAIALMLIGVVPVLLLFL